MEVIILWLLLSAVIGAFAKSRGRSGIGFFFLSCLISPIISGILVAIAPNLTQQRAVQQEIAVSKTCPQCAEMVKAAAKVCRFCHHEFTTPGDLA